ncbi:MAG TPA: peptide deformylase [Candidatus Saccharimonadales bacterium]|nr:peptide deformylase [Candidatus Saccharimonadales bacterium]
MKIVQAPNSVLSTVARPVEKIDKYIKNLLTEMETSLASATDPEGVGLAAPQIGKSLQIFIVKENPEANLKTFINPVIEEFFQKPAEKKTVQSTKTTKAKKKAGIKKGVQLEGCLSLQDIWGVVKRHDGVVLSFMDENGEQHKESFDGFMSTIIQHETDHLNGILFPKRVLEQKEKLYKSIKNKKGETEFEELEI